MGREVFTYRDRDASTGPECSQHILCTLPDQRRGPAVTAADFEGRACLRLEKDRGVVKRDPYPSVDPSKAAIHIEQRNMDTRWCSYNHPVLVEELAVRELLFNEDERLAAVDNPVLAREQRLVFTDGEDPVHVTFCRGYPSGEDLPPGFDMVALDDLSDGNVSTHKIVSELRCQPGNGCLRFRVDQHLTGGSVKELHDPVIHRIARCNAEMFCGIGIGFHDLLFAGPDRNRMTGH